MQSESKKVPLVEGKWLNLYEITSSKGSRLQFERPVKEPSTERLSSGSDIIALGKVEGRVKIILEIIYRLPVEQYLIQLPAGLRDPHERDLVVSALRELKEETGYIGKAPSSDWILKLKPILESPLIYNDPWKSNETTKLVTVEVDFSAEENVNPKPHLEDDEDIEVIVLDLLNLSDELAHIEKTRGFQVDNRVHQLALGLDLAK